MNKEIARYRRELRKQLPCLPHRKKQMLDKFESALLSFLEDCPNPVYAQLKAAFGPPEEMALVLMEAVPEKEKRHFVLWQRVGRDLLILLFILTLVFCFYVYYLNELTIITVYDDVYPLTSTITQEGESK